MFGIVIGGVFCFCVGFWEMREVVRMPFIAYPGSGIRSSSGIMSVRLV